MIGCKISIQSKLSNFLTNRIKKHGQTEISVSSNFANWYVKTYSTLSRRLSNGDGIPWFLFVGIFWNFSCN
jgi:hypothetical protein